MRLFIPIGALLSIASFTASSNDLVGNLQQCKQIENALERLVCFDNVSKNLPTISKELPAITGLKTTSAPAKQQPKVSGVNQRFGFEHKTDTSDLPDAIHGVVTLVKRGPYKKYVIHLDNGHVWKQTDDIRLKLAIGDNVIVKRGALNSFFIGKDGVNKRMRVKRAN